MIDAANLDNLLLYKDDKKKSFEELCYQICKEEYATSGKFTPVDDSGGGDGVEFYLTTKDNEIWGWQCKFFDRLNDGGRKEQIKKSLKRAYQTHGSKLKKWFLCSKKSWTPQEKEWFEDKLGNSICEKDKVLPDNHNVELIHWGDSDMLSLLSKHINIYNFFFNDKIISFDWFRTKASEVFSKSSIKIKYISDVHTECQAQEEVYRIIGGKHLALVMQERYDTLNVDKFILEFEQNIQDLETFEINPEYQPIFEEIKPFILANKKIISEGKVLIVKEIDVLKRESLEETIDLTDITNKYIDKIREFYSHYSSYKDSILIKPINWDTEKEEDKNKKQVLKENREILFNTYFTLKSYIRPFINILDSIEQIKQQELHITGGASKGKTHLVANIFEKHIEENKPAIFLSGKDFISTLTIEEQILSLLDIPRDWIFAKFLDILNYYGRVYDTKSLIIIDGLNESIYWKTLWESGLENLISKIASYKNITLITTYRESYEDQLFPNGYFFSDFKNYIKRSYVDGFENDNIDEAIRKYAQYYNVTINNQSDAVYYFQNEPLCLRIFCETKKGKTVDLLQESLFDVFDQYIKKRNENILNILNKNLRYNQYFLVQHLEYIANYLWEYNVSSIPFSELIPGKLKEDELFAIESEDLLVFPDWRRGKETLSFTYDLLAGYIIAKNILAQCKNKNEYITLLSDNLKAKLLSNDSRHPLFEDILHCLCILSIKKFGLIYDEIDTAPYCKYVINSIYEINPNDIADNESKIKTYINNLFNQYSDSILHKSSSIEFDINHPLNFNYTSDLLKTLSTSDRDLLWSEEIRKEYECYHYRDIKSLIEKFEKNCRGEQELRGMIHLAAKQVMWCLTSTNQKLRYNATRALYFYGKKYPIEFCDLFHYSSDINDIYVFERMLAIAYGIALSFQDKNTEKTNIEGFLFPISREIYSVVFSENRTIKTTHILVRDFARNTIKVSLLHNPSFFSKVEKEQIFNTVQTITKDDINKWNEVESCGGPIEMDFSNYTLGSIIPDGHSYSNPPLKKKARWYLYNRINEFGWTKDKFSDIDKKIASNRYSYSRHNDSSKIDRYGKKYSWIAYYEVAGILDNISLLENEWRNYRVVNADIDPTFPEKTKEYKLKLDDFLGNRNVESDEWLKAEDPIDINNCLYGKLLKEDNFICAYGFFCSENKLIKRKRFTFIRPIIVRENDKSRIVELLNKQDIGGRWIPEIQTNDECFAGEINCWDEATYSNWVDLSFEVGTTTQRATKAEAEPELQYSHIQQLLYNLDLMSNDIPNEEVEYIDVPRKQTENFKVLLPTMEYNHGNVFSCGTSKIISKEISFFANLEYQPQSFDLIDKNGNIASIGTVYNKSDYNNSQGFLFIRKDILDNYLEKNNMSMIWCIWGEKDVSEQPYQFVNFQQIQEYNNQVTQ